jgi:hypothetical protein
MKYRAPTGGIDVLFKRTKETNHGLIREDDDCLIYKE